MRSHPSVIRTPRQLVELPGQAGHKFVVHYISTSSYMLKSGVCLHVCVQEATAESLLRMLVYPSAFAFVCIYETNSTPLNLSLISAPPGALQPTQKGRGEPERLRPRTGAPRRGRGAFKSLVWARWDQQTQLICHRNAIFTSFQFQRAFWLH